MELFNALGLNLKILAAQLINFAVLFFVLYRFGYKPLLQFLDDRKAQIEQGVSDAKKAQERLVELEQKEKDIVIKAKKEALAIIEEAKNKGEEKRDSIIKKAKEEIGEIINAEKAKMRVEKAETLKEIKKEISGLIMDSLEKVLAENIDEKRDKALIKKIAKNIK